MRLNRREIAVMLVVLIFILAVGPILVFGAEAGALGYQGMPEWFWPAFVTGVIQGAVVFGGVKVKLDWIFQRIGALETADKELNARIDRALVREPTGRAGDH